MHKLRDFIILPDDLQDNLLYKSYIESTQYYVSMYGTTYQTTPMYLP
jgi:hypothetical protein